jgi:hypothetical protein
MDNNFIYVVFLKVMGLMLIQEEISRWQISEHNYRSGSKIKHTILKET